MRLVLFAAATATLLAGPVLAASEASTPVENKDSARKERMICKTSDQIGSRLRKNKSCRTAKEWADLSAQTQEKTRDIQRVGLKSE